MGVVKFDQDELSHTVNRLARVNSNLQDAVSKTSSTNKTFMAIQTGGWSDAQGEACINIETQGRLLHEAMKGVEDKFKNLSKDAGDVQTKRDTFLTAMGTSAEPHNIVMCVTEGTVSTSCSNAMSELSTMSNIVNCAVNATEGLRDKGAIIAALNSVKTDASDEMTKIRDIDSAWTDFSQAAGTFDSKYGTSDVDSPNSFRSKSFITDTAVENVHIALVNEYNSSDYGKIHKFLYGDGKNDKGAKGFLKTAQNWLYRFGKPLAQLGNKNTGITLKNLGSEIKKAGIFGGLKAGFHDMKAAILGQTDDALKAGANTASKCSGKFGRFFKRAGTFAKGFGKVLGVAGDVMSIYGIYSDTDKAYKTTVGDRAQKEAAATIAATKGIAKFGIGKAVGIAVGSFGGPLGMAAGMLIGAGVDYLVGKAFDYYESSGQQQRDIDRLANTYRGQSNKKNAYAAG